MQASPSGQHAPNTASIIEHFEHRGKHAIITCPLHRVRDARTPALTYRGYILCSVRSAAGPYRVREATDRSFSGVRLEVVHLR